jgi:8-oxo-dGTP pyrophosphatase MutT (NUDIX family)
MKECKCKCGGCAKKGGALSLDVIYTKGGYTVEELKVLWGEYDSLLDLYYKLNNNLEASNKIILIIISFRGYTNIKKLYDYYDVGKHKITLVNIESLCTAIINKIRMEPFFVIKISNAHNLLYSSDFTKETLKQNLIQYELYKSYVESENDYSVSSDTILSLVSVNSGNNLEFIKNPLNNCNNSVISAHVLIVKDMYSDNKKILMLTHKPTVSRGTLIETDCRLGPPGGIIDPTDSTPWNAMLREYKEEAGLDFPKQHTLINTFIWKNKYLIFLVSTDNEISEMIVDNNEIYSRKWFSVKDLKEIITGSIKGSKQVKGSFKMRNGAFESTSAIIEFMGY